MHCGDVIICSEDASNLKMEGVAKFAERASCRLDMTEKRDYLLVEVCGLVSLHRKPPSVVLVVAARWANLIALAPHVIGLKAGRGSEVVWVTVETR